MLVFSGSSWPKPIIPIIPGWRKKRQKNVTAKKRVDKKTQQSRRVFVDRVHTHHNVNRKRRRNNNISRVNSYSSVITRWFRMDRTSTSLRVCSRVQSRDVHASGPVKNTVFSSSTSSIRISNYHIPILSLTFCSLSDCGPDRKDHFLNTKDMKILITFPGRARGDGH